MRRVRRTAGGQLPARRLDIDVAVGLIAYLLLAGFAITVLYPLVFVVSASMSGAEALGSGQVWLLPIDITFEAYQTLIDSPRLVRGFLNSMFYTVAGAAIGTGLTVLAGYALSRPDLPFRRTIMFFFLIPTLFSAGIIPTYIIVQSLGLVNTVWAVILPGAMSVFTMIITRTFYQINVPLELLDAARVDGANDFRFFFRVALPLSKPIIAVNLLFYGVAQWNGWFGAFIYLNDSDLFPLQLVLRDILAQSRVDPATIGGADIASIIASKELFDKLKYALIVVAMIPPLIAYPFVQKHFVKGALIGSLK